MLWPLLQQGFQPANMYVCLYACMRRGEPRAVLQYIGSTCLQCVASDGAVMIDICMTNGHLALDGVGAQTSHVLA